MSKQASKLQDSILNQIRKERIAVTMYTVNGKHMRGNILSFDDYTILLQDERKFQNLIYKSALSTLISDKQVSWEFNSNKQPSKLQDSILNGVRIDGTPTTIYTVNGKHIKGQVLSFDGYTILLQDAEGKHSLIYKSALSTVIPDTPQAWE